MRNSHILLFSTFRENISIIPVIYFYTVEKVKIY